MLLRLTPGPAEALFGITAAPMAVIADWHGRVTRTDLNLRGDIPAACRRLRAELRGFDFKEARRPPFEVPDWAASLVQAEGRGAMLAHLEAIHPVGGSRQVERRKLERLACLYRSLDREGELLAFCANYVAACEERAPAYGERYPGHTEEAALLQEMSYCRNDKVKFDAIQCHGRFAPVGDVGFFVERARRRQEGCSNPNVVLCRCLSGIALAVERHPGPRDRDSRRDRREIMSVLPLLVEVLDTEGRNNGACTEALEAIQAIAVRAGAPEALEAWIHNFNGPTPDSEWLEDYTESFLTRTYDWLADQTAQDLGFDFDAWQRWYRENEKKLFYDGEKGRFVLDARAARIFRARVSRR